MYRPGTTGLVDLAYKIKLPTYLPLCVCTENLQCFLYSPLVWLTTRVLSIAISISVVRAVERRYNKKVENALLTLTCLPSGSVEVAQYNHEETINGITSPFIRLSNSDRAVNCFHDDSDPTINGITSPFIRLSNSDRAVNCFHDDSDPTVQQEVHQHRLCSLVADSLSGHSDETRYSLVSLKKTNYTPPSPPKQNKNKQKTYALM